jgi:hypothetical protein
LLDLIYWWMSRNLDEKQRQKLDMDLEEVPVTLLTSGSAATLDQTVWSDEAEMAAFRSSMR